MPSYVVYRHFLAWISALDQGAKKQGVTDSYSFAQPFIKSIAFSTQELDVLKRHAKLLEDDLARQDAKAGAIIISYRQSAQAAIKAGRPLPSLPPELQLLQQQKTAMIIHHYTAFRSSLGLQASSKLDVYLAREFAPHITVQPLSSTTGKSGPASAETAAGFTVPLH